MRLVRELPEVEYTLMHLHESLDVWSRLMQKTFARCNIINLREILDTEFLEMGNNQTQILTPTLSRVIRQSLTPGDPQ